VTDKRGATTADRPTQTRRKKARPEVDRAALASVVRPRVDELIRQGATRAEVAVRAGCGESVLRSMANGTGGNYFSVSLLSRVADNLGLQRKLLVNAFYPPAPHNPKLPSEAEQTAQQVMDRFAPYLAKIDAIPEMQKDIAAIKERMTGMDDAIHEVNSTLTSFVDISRTHPTEQPTREDPQVVPHNAS
jgi:hypothetical protein